MNMTQTQKPPLAFRLYVKARPMSERGDQLLKGEDESMATMLCYMMLFLLAYPVILLIFSSSTPNSKIWQIPYFRFYISAVAGSISVMFVYAVYNVIAQSARMWKLEKDNLDCHCHQWEEEDLSPQTLDL